VSHPLHDLAVNDFAKTNLIGKNAPQ
jgi:hypothetical protein